MIRIERNLVSNLILVCSVLVFSSCSSPKPPTPTVFMGHTIGESSMRWSSSENTSDPLSRCQEILRSPLSNALLDVTQQCQDFVNNGNYLIIVQDAHQIGREKAYRFVHWKVVMIVVEFPLEEESNLIKELNSHFAVVVPGEKWLGKDGAAVEIRPNVEYRLFTGKTPKSDGFLVVVSSADGQ
jgi:hypothetical protein